MRHHWPGNVRELRNAADRMMLGLPAIDGADGKQPSARSLDEQMAMFERHLIEEALTSCGGSHGRRQRIAAGAQENALRQAQAPESGGGRFQTAMTHSPQ